jgi:uncharacterized protein YkwD
MTDHLSRLFVVTIVLVGVVSVAGCLESVDVEAPDDVGNPGDAGDSGTTSSTEKRAAINETAVERWVHRFTNEEREAEGLEPLARNETLDDVAGYHSDDMIEREYYSHQGPSGETVEDRFEKFDMDCREYYGEVSYFRGSENIMQISSESNYSVLYHYDTPRELGRKIVDAWMGSKGHRENILTPYWTTEGIGINITDDRIVATQNFCKQTNESARVSRAVAR